MAIETELQKLKEETLREMITAAEIELQKLKERPIREINNAENQSNTKKIIEAYKKLEEIWKLEAKNNELRLALQNIQKGETFVMSADVQNKKITVKVSSKGRGKSARMKFVELLRKRGFNCQNTKGQTYNINDKVVGIAFASGHNKTNKWFLGLKSGLNYHTIVLLCETDSDKLTAFIFSSETFKKYSSLLSKDTGGQFKFNVYRTSDTYQLKIPGDGVIELDKFVDAFENLRQ
jgi:hypothetical protein